MPPGFGTRSTGHNDSGYTFDQKLKRDLQNFQLPLIPNPFLPNPHFQFIIHN
jgi:hypothetical protein